VALIEEVTEEGERYYAVVFAGLPGTQLEVDELDEAKYRAWGRALGMLHRAAQTFPPHPARPRWYDEIRAALRGLPPDETVVAHVLASGLAWPRCCRLTTIATASSMVISSLIV
jgi:Ser/Thr protein kinase RdoA (MazF antagonist)